MFVKSIIIPERGSVAVTVADENSGGAEHFFVSRGLWQKLVAETPIKELDPVDSDTYDRIAMSAEMTSALKEGSRIIGNADRSESEVARRLKQKGFSSTAVEYAVTVLKKHGYLDEDEICVRVAELQLRSKHYGRRRILTYLLSHGYKSEAAEAAVDSIPDEDYADALWYNIKKKFPNISGLDRAEQQKAIASLMRLGFGTGEIFDAIKEKNR